MARVLQPVWPQGRKGRHLLPLVRRGDRRAPCRPQPGCAGTRASRAAATRGSAPARRGAEAAIEAATGGRADGRLRRGPGGGGPVHRRPPRPVGAGGRAGGHGAGDGGGRERDAGANGRGARRAAPGAARGDGDRRAAAPRGRDERGTAPGDHGAAGLRRGDVSRRPAIGCTRAGATPARRAGREEHAVRGARAGRGERRVARLGLGGLRRRTGPRGHVARALLEVLRPAAGSRLPDAPPDRGRHGGDGQGLRHGQAVGGEQGLPVAASGLPHPLHRDVRDARVAEHRGLRPVHVGRLARRPPGARCGPVAQMGGARGQVGCGVGAAGASAAGAERRVVPRRAHVGWGGLCLCLAHRRERAVAGVEPRGGDPPALRRAPLLAVRQAGRPGSPDDRPHELP